MNRRSALAVAALAVTTGLLTTPAAVAQESPRPTEEPAIRVSLQTVEPAAPRPGDTLVLAGTVENVSEEPLGVVNATLRYSRSPLDDRSDVRRVATAGRELRWGQREPDFWDEDIASGELSPGETADFTIPILVDELDLGEAGIYVLGVDVRATPIVDGEPDGDLRFTANTTRTVIPWLPSDDPLPTVPVGLLWPLAAQPSLLPDGTMLDDALAEQLAAGGTLSGLVETAGDEPVTWAVDPDLLATAAEMAEGYRISAGGTTSEGTGADAATAWLEAYTTATEGAQTLLLPYANPDIEALAAADQPAAEATARAALDATEASRDGQPSVVWPAGGAAGEDALAAYASAGAETVILSGDAVTPETGDLHALVRAGETDLPAVLTDGGLDAAVSDATVTDDPAAGGAALRQGWLAETAMLALDAADEGEPAAPVVATAPYAWQPDPIVAQALIDVWTESPWITPTTLDSLEPPRAPPVVEPMPPDEPEPLSPDYVAQITELREQGAHYAALLAEPDGIVDRLGAAVLRSASSSWRSDPEAGAAYTDVATTTATSRLGQVSVQVPPSVTLSSRKGTFPLTVSNDLSEPVMVGLRLTPDNPDRMAVAEVTPQRVEAGENATIEVTAEAAVNGKVPMTVQLTAVDGSLLGTSRRTIVNATDYGTIGWVVVGGAAALFLATAVLGPARRRRRDRVGGEHAATQPGAEIAVAPEPQRETAR